MCIPVHIRWCIIVVARLILSTGRHICHLQQKQTRLLFSRWLNSAFCGKISCTFWTLGQSCSFSFFVVALCVSVHNLIEYGYIFVSTFELNECFRIAGDQFCFEFYIALFGLIDQLRHIMLLLAYYKSYLFSRATALRRKVKRCFDSL